MSQLSLAERWIREARTTLTLALAAASLTACADNTSARTPSAIAVVSGNNETLVAGTASTSTLVVSVLDQNGAALEGVSVTWAISSGEGSLTAASSTTDANGQASMTFSPGADAGTTTITATVSGLTPVDFTLTVATADDGA